MHVDVYSALRQARTVLRQALVLAFGSAALVVAWLGFGIAAGFPVPYWLGFEGALVVAVFAALASRPASKRIRELMEQFPNDERVHQTRGPGAIVPAIWLVAVADLVPILYSFATVAL